MMKICEVLAQEAKEAEEIAEAEERGDVIPSSGQRARCVTADEKYDMMAGQQLIEQEKEHG